MPNFEILVYILIIHWKEAVLYFTLSCIAGLLIFCSCVLGDYLSKSLSRTPRHRHRLREMQLLLVRSFPFIWFSEVTASEADAAWGMAT